MGAKAEMDEGTTATGIGGSSEAAAGMALGDVGNVNQQGERGEEVGDGTSQQNYCKTDL